MEQSFVAWLRELKSSHPAVEVGIGDDAAVLRTDGERWVVTTDMLLEGVHFLDSLNYPERAGRKAMAVNLSDLAAMAARPVAAFVSLAVPRGGDSPARARAVIEGMLELTERWQFAIAGGDTNTWTGPLAINVALVGGAVGAPLLRSGAKPGDAVVVTGQLGGSLQGRHYDFMPRIDEALALRRDFVVRAGADISDGLALDAARMAAASGCGAAIDLAAIPVSPAAVSAAASAAASGSAGELSAVQRALGDGEDFELLLAMPWAEAQRAAALQPLDTPVTVIGRFVEPRGLWELRPGGGLQPLPPRGYEHLE